MFKPLGGLLWTLLLIGFTHGSPLGDAQPHVLETRQSCNTASNRQCWTSNFDINTDYEAHVPETGVTRQVNPGSNCWYNGDANETVHLDLDRTKHMERGRWAVEVQCYACQW